MKGLFVRKCLGGIMGANFKSLRIKSLRDRAKGFLNIC